jgi:hypothetical protein
VKKFLGKKSEEEKGAKKWKEYNKERTATKEGNN